MGELRYMFTVRRKGCKPHTGEVYRTEDFESVNDLIDHIEHDILVEFETEEEYSFRNEGTDEAESEG